MRLNTATILKMPEIYSALKDDNLDFNNITLYFLERTKKNDVISHKVWRTELNSRHNQIEKELWNIAKIDVKSKTDESYNYHEYAPMAIWDKNVIEVMFAGEIPYYEDIYDKIYGDPDVLDGTKIKNIKTIWGYVVTIDIFDNERDVFKNLIFIKKHSPLKLLGKGKLNMVMHKDSGKFDKIEDNIFALDNKYDGMIYRGREQPSEDISEIMYIFNKNNIEAFFDFSEGYKKEIDNKKDRLVEHKLIDEKNLDILVDFSTKSKDLTKKLATVLKNKSYEIWTPERIGDLKSKYHVEGIEFDENDNLVINAKNYATVIKVLDDDYLKSEYSGNKYETHSKIKK
ncbi:hypothetical protein HNP86_001571 [Methanococcus maripaludis]|uniref:Uncharacterized protein n=1 Tax=Methanococcus maripaludis TaxID=39152 RepID=A0A7J9NUQ9_METMI|nr:Kiwa anti-phage protein KwaB-like domain-containing protein [Methanococcus maripaludis]MBA2851418.1 hypothetical protein [Methanococcus maripaludis]